MMIKTSLLLLFYISNSYSLRNYESSLKCIRSRGFEIGTGSYDKVDSFEYIHENSMEFQYKYDRDAMTTFGKPECVVGAVQNGTHSYVWYGAVSQNVLPVECRYTVGMQCFRDIKLDSLLPNSEISILCCCSYDMCNKNHPRFFAELSAVRRHIFMIGFYRFSAVAGFLGVVLFFYSIMELALGRMYVRQTRRYLLTDVRFGEGGIEGDQNIEFYEMPDLSIQQTQNDPVAEAEDQKRVDEYIAEEEERAEKLRLEKLEAERSRVPPTAGQQTPMQSQMGGVAKSRMGAPAPATAAARRESMRPNRNLPTANAQIATSTKKGAPATALSMKSDDKKDSATPMYTPWKKKKKVKKDKTAISTESTQEDEVYAIPPKPASRVLQGGRIQGTSMNYNESTFSDLA